MSAIADKIRKLLALATSNNPHEAAAAASRAQELMIKYAVEEEEVRGRDPSASSAEPIEVEELFWSGQGPKWEGILAEAMSRSFLCRCYRDRASYKIYMVGRASAREVFKATYLFIKDEINRLAKSGWEVEKHAYAELLEPKMVNGKGRAWRTSFGLGAVSTISHRLNDNMKKLTAGTTNGATPTSTAIVLVSRQKELDTYIAVNLRLTKGSRARYSAADGYTAGRIAGNNIDISKRAGKALP